MAKGKGTKQDPWVLKTPPGTSEYRMYRDEVADPQALDAGCAWDGGGRGRSQKIPVRGWYGLKKGLRGRFGMYLPPLLEALGLAEITHEARNNRMRAR